MDSTQELLEKDEDLKATESRIVELRQKKDRTAEEEKEFAELRKHHKGRIEEQIQNERDAVARERTFREKAEQDLADARARLKVIEEKRDTTVASGNENETYEVNGKKFYTDDAIALRVQNGLMTQREGWAMQRSGIQEETIARLQGDEPKKKWMTAREASLKAVREQGYGHFLDDKDPKHNANDPLFKEAERLWKDGLEFDADGPRKALDYAKRLLGKDVKREDLSDDFSVAKNNAAASSQREKKIELSEIEKDNAYRYYVVGNIINSKTGKHYTEIEAHSKALEAKRKRLVK